MQNPRLPLRFVIQAVYIERLKTSNALVFAANNHDKKKTHCESADAHTPGALPQRDVELHQVAQLQSTMDATSYHIQNMEKELRVMKQIIDDNTEGKRIQINRGISSSCRQDLGKKVEKGQKGSLSSIFIRRGNKISDEAQILDNDYNNSGSSNTTKVEQKNFGTRLMNGLKRVFGVGTSNKKNGGGSKAHKVIV